MSSIKRRIEALEKSVKATTPDLPKICVVGVYGGASSGPEHYAWAAEDLSDLIERQPGESDEAFSKRAEMTFDAAETVVAFNVAPRLDEWGMGARMPELEERIRQLKGSNRTS